VGPDTGEDAALLRSQGGFIPQWSSAWRLGELFLSAEKLAFVQPGKPRFELSLATVTDVAMERRKFILLHKDVVRLTYVLPNQKRPRLAWFITAAAGRWFDEIMTLTKAGRAAAGKDAAGAPGTPDGAQPARASRPAPRLASGGEPVLVREDQVEELVATLSPAGARILWHLWERRHADIKELARVADSCSHMEVLTLLREGINGAAERLFGHPVLVFEERALDRVSGRVVCFQWWLERADEPGLEAGLDLEAGTGRLAEPEVGGPAPSALDPAEPFVEIHDEGETLIVVVIGPGVGAETVRAPQVQDGDTLVVVLETAAGRRELVVRLPCNVQTAPVTAASANGIASLTLVKETREGRGDEHAGGRSGDAGSGGPVRVLRGARRGRRLGAARP
jgi:HSP20 family molecular chaperone IbpA